MKKEEIYFTFKKTVPETLFAEYKNRKAEIGLSLVPQIMESKKVLLFEEQLKLAQNYLKTILHKDFEEEEEELEEEEDDDDDDVNFDDEIE